MTAACSRDLYANLVVEILSTIRYGLDVPYFTTILNYIIVTSCISYLPLAKGDTTFVVALPAVRILWELPIPALSFKVSL